MRRLFAGACLLLCASSASADRAKSRTIYLNRHGATVRPGENNAAAQTSTVVKAAAAIPAWDVTDAKWAATVACMKTMWSRFDVAITETDPGATPHVEALFGGMPEDIGKASNVAGIAPFAGDCSVTENAIVFAFTDALPADPETVCEVMTQEIGHAYGLDHELLAADPMSYLPYSGTRSFQEATAECGESTPRHCGLASTACRTTQSSTQLLYARLGTAGGDGSAPSLAITSPQAHGEVEAGFTVHATASDDGGIASVALYVDGAKTATLTAGPFDLATDPALPNGMHTLMVEARDANDNVTVREVEVTVADPPPWSALGCSAGGAPGAGVALALLALVKRRRPTS